MTTVTLLQLRTDVRQRADMVNSTFCTDAEINGYINKSYKEFFDLLVDAVEDYSLTTESFTLTDAALGVHALPAGFYKLRGLDDLTNSDYPRSVRRYNWNERNDFNTYQTVVSPYKFSNVMYRVVGANLLLLPPQNAAKPYKLWYVAIPADLSGDSDSFEAINGWDQYVVLDAAIKCLLKEESDVSGLLGERSKIIARIQDMKNSRDDGLPEKISRVRNPRGANRYPFNGDFES